MKRIRLLLVDDQSAFREGLRAILELCKEVEIAGEASNGIEALRLATDLKPDVVLMDLRMPSMGGVQATRKLTEAGFSGRVLVFTTFDEDEEIFEALRAGASGYLLKGCGREKLMEAIRAAASGESFLQPSIAAKVVAEFSKLTNAPRLKSSLIENLSDREEEVLRELARGKSNKEIGVTLDLAEGTVKNHMTNILGKLGVLDRTQAALKARELGIL